MDNKYLKEIVSVIKKLDETQSDNMAEASNLIAAAIVDNKQIFSFGASHSFIITEELVYRTGGLMLINPIYPYGMDFSVKPMTLTSQIERLSGYGKLLLDYSSINDGDVLILASTSGRNPVIIDMALAARERNIAVIGITSFEYTNAVTSRHASGKKFIDLCDIAIDNCAPYGDALVGIDGFSEKVAPASSITGIAIANQIVSSVVEILVSMGYTAPVFISANTDVGDAHNKDLLDKNREKIHYM